MEFIQNMSAVVKTILEVAEEFTQINYISPNGNIHYHNKINCQRIVNILIQHYFLLIG